MIVMPLHVSLQHRVSPSVSLYFFMRSLHYQCKREIFFFFYWKAFIGEELAAQGVWFAQSHTTRTSQSLTLSFISPTSISQHFPFLSTSSQAHCLLLGLLHGFPTGLPSFTLILSSPSLLRHSFNICFFEHLYMPGTVLSAELQQWSKSQSWYPQS